MFIRVFRLTDKFGLVLLKLTAAIGDWLLDGASIIVDTLRGGSLGILGIIGSILRLVVNALQFILGGILSVILVVLGIIQAILQRIFQIVRRVAQLLWRGISRLFGITTHQAATAARTAGTRTASAGSGAMARRAARAEMEAGLAEDPLKVQKPYLECLVCCIGCGCYRNTTLGNGSKPKRQCGSCP